MLIINNNYFFIVLIRKHIQQTTFFREVKRFSMVNIFLNNFFLYISMTIKYVDYLVIYIKKNNSNFEFY